MTKSSGPSAMEELLGYATVRESSLFRGIHGDKIECMVCERRCRLEDGMLGFCSTRANIGGKMYTLVYGDISAQESRPIEIKPFFHYWPGSTAFTISTWSCNFTCPWCQNNWLSRTRPDPRSARFTDPMKIVETAISYRDKGLCVSFQEPTILADYALDLFKLAKERGLYCCFVSNGYMTLEFLELLRESGMDGLKIDVKGGADIYAKYLGGANQEVVWRNARHARKIGIHIEIVNLVITDLNDSEQDFEEIVSRHLKELGEDIPIHFTRYFPAYKFHNPPTDVWKLENAREIAKREGIRYAYIGNVPGHPYENTYCHNCSRQLIKRFGSHLIRYDVTKDKRCPSCGIEIPIVGQAPI